MWEQLEDMMKSVFSKKNFFISLEALFTKMGGAKNAAASWMSWYIHTQNYDYNQLEKRMWQLLDIIELLLIMKTKSGNIEIKVWFP